VTLPIDAAAVAARLGGALRSGDGWVARCPAHDDKRASLSINDGDDGKLLVKCHAGCPQDEVVAVLKGLGLWPVRARALATGRAHGIIAAAYDYRDEEGRLVMQTVRYQPKTFRQRCPSRGGDDPAKVRDGWFWGTKGRPKLPYRLPELRAGIAAGATVWITEGEKDADRLAGEGLVATTNIAGGINWAKEHSAFLKGTAVVILEDNDDTGRKRTEKIAASLVGIARSVKVLRFEELPEHGDVSDWLDAGGTVEGLCELAEAAPERGKANGHAATPPEPGAVVLDDVAAFLGRFVAYPSEHARIAHTLWVAHAHMMEQWDSTPRIAFLSPEPASGKTRALEVTELLVPNPIVAVNMSAAYLFRKVGSKDRPTILYDEIDTVFGPRAREHEDIRALLNAGHRRGAVAGRCVMKGKTVHTEEIPAYCAVALAGLGDLPDTIMTRSIIIGMKRRAPGEEVAAFRRSRYEKEGARLAARLAAWCADNADALDFPELPPEIADRNADVWEPLLMIADRAGGHWPAVARVAAVALVALTSERNTSLGIRLLRDVLAAFARRNEDSISTSILLNELINTPESPWGDLKGKPISDRRLASMLKRYDVRPVRIRVGERVERGYKAEDLHDAWARYLSTSLKEALHALQASEAPRAQGDLAV
jgi:uncharacterized protein DUF3631